MGFMGPGANQVIGLVLFLALLIAVIAWMGADLLHAIALAKGKRRAAAEVEKIRGGLALDDDAISAGAIEGGMPWAHQRWPLTKSEARAVDATMLNSFPSGVRNFGNPSGGPGKPIHRSK